MEFIASLDTYDRDQAAQNIWNRLSQLLAEKDGICYYKHPVIESATRITPDLAFLSEDYEPVVIRIITLDLNEIREVQESTWSVQDKVIDSPFLEIDDFIISLRSKFEKQRILRRRLDPIGVLALPLILKNEFESKFKMITNITKFSTNTMKVIWRDLSVSEFLIPLKNKIGPREWRAAKSVFQGVNPLNKQITDIPDNSEKMGGAINILEKDIALLDDQQHKVAIQMAPGPQRIRGLAGTGKTVVLAMKAANIHRRYPDKQILFTFHTQSLYNQAKTLITKFYREYSDSDPDWDKLHVRHGWGGISRPGVYYDLCRRLNIMPLTYQDAKRLDNNLPFRACCQNVLKHETVSFYDFILVDEAQDFPKEFFMLLAKLVTLEKKIYFAYDELQSLSAVEVPRPEDLFGLDDKGKPFITLEGEDYPGGIEKDFVLHKSYRCPLDILMLAHGIGLGIHGPHGCVQMLGNRASWESIGYAIEKGNLKYGEETIIFRPPANSPNRIKQIYTGQFSIVQIENFHTRDIEISWVAESICSTIGNESVRPEDIVVISLDIKKSKDYLSRLQLNLEQRGVKSIIPGLVDQSWEFGESGRVTLSTVYRAKGNEAPVVYILAFDALYSYVEEIESRNRAFTSISRAKGWLRITGAGKQMTEVKKEIDKIIQDIPNAQFKFIFPDMENIGIRRLDASETSRRRKQVNKAKTSINALLGLDKEALKDVDTKTIKKLKKMIDEVESES